MLVAERGKLSLLTVLALSAATLVVFESSPARASYYESGVSLSTDIVRDDVTYRLNVKALDTMGGYRLEMSISRRIDTAGSGALRQRQTWNFTLQPEEFTDDRGTYRIDAGSDTGPFRVNLIAEHRPDADCSQAQELFVSQSEGGGFRIETGNDVFGTITEMPECAKTWSYSSGPRPGPPPCPVAGQELFSGSLDVEEWRASDVARFDVHQALERDVPGGMAKWELLVSGTLPASSFRLNRDLEGFLRAAGPPWIEGEARFEPERAPVRGDWYDCRGGREARSLSGRGAITGNLTLEVIGYDDYTVADPQAWGQRSRVRQRQ